MTGTFLIPSLTSKCLTPVRLCASGGRAHLHWEKDHQELELLTPYPALKFSVGPTRATRAYPEATLPTSADIYDKVSGELQKNGYDCECLGGGRISHQSQDRKIHVYGYSMVSFSPRVSARLQSSPL